ncbi:MAG: glycosyl transferase family 36 [Planctomycetota bacterium]
MLGNRYGQFSQSGRAFHIADAQTPMPWTNIVCNGRYGFVVSQNGGGFSWLDNSQLNVVSRWDMDMVMDRSGRFVLLSDLESGEIWSAAPAPTFPEYDRYECVHEPGRTTFHTAVHGIGMEWSLAVAEDEPIEVWRVLIRNESGRDRRLRVASYLEWCCGAAPDVKREFHRLFITTEHDEARRAIVATKNMWDVPVKDPKEHWAKPWPYTTAHALLAGEFERALATADKELFLGRYQKTASPEGMSGDLPGARFGRFSDPCAAIGGDLVLKANEEHELFFAVCIDKDRESVNAMIDKYSSRATASCVLVDAPEVWDRILGESEITCGEDSFAALNNTWLPYQAISARLWGRTGYYQQSGAYGYRDQLQDSQVWLLRDPERCAQQIKLHAAHQFEDGSVYHWWHPLTEAGLRTTCSDDYLWLPFVTASYLRETDDWALLDTVQPFADGDARVSILEHCLRSFELSFSRVGAHGLPLIGAMDWNDGLSAVGVEERGESVWLGHFLAGLLEDWSLILERVGDSARAADFVARREALVKAINEHAWDGAWFRRATTDAGDWIGSRENTHGRIFLNAQTWAILNDTADQDRQEQAWASVKEHLVREMGALLLVPAYDTPDPAIGYITRYCPGARENGGVYMHAATWAVAAAAKMGDTSTLAKIWHGISPPIRAELDADRYRAEPYVTPGNVDGPDSDMPGKAGWTWYTGSAAWLNRVSMEWVLGIRAVWDGLTIDPKPFAELGQVSFVRVWRGRRLRVSFDASQYAPENHAVVMIDGEVHEGVLRESDLPEGRDEFRVTVSWVEIGAHPVKAEPKPVGVDATVR